MNKKVLIVSGIIVAAIIGFSISMMNNPPVEKQNNTTKTTTSTSKTSPTDPNIKTDLEDNIDTSNKAADTDKDDTSNSGLSTADRASYIDFESAKQFKSTEGTRVLFFYLSSSKACKQLDKDLQENIATLDPKTTIFKIDIKKHADIAKAYGVIKETTILKFDDKGQVDDMFIAYDYPTAQALKTNLQI